VRELEEAAAPSSALGVELAAYRRAAGYTQAQFAELTEYSRSTIANVETGRQHVSRDFWERADRVLRTGGVLATGYDETETAARRQLRAAARGVSTSRQARTWQLRSGAAPDVSDAGKADGDVALAPSTQIAFRPADPDLPWPPPAGTALAELSMSPDALPARYRLARGPRDNPRPISLGDIARLASMRQHLKAIDNAHGGGAALPMADGYLRCEVLPLLDGSLGDPTSRALIAVVAQFQHDVGWMAYDGGQQPLATQYFHSALRFAHAAGNRLLGGRILAAMSHQAIYLGHLRQAIDFAQAARNITRQVATPRTVAMLAAMEACAHAAAGDAKQSWHALGDAAEALPLVVDRSEPEWLDFDEGGFLGHAARAYRDLGHMRKAEEYAAKSVGLCLRDHSRTRAQRTTIQATAYLSLGEVDAAAAAAERVVREAWNLHSGHVFGEVAQLVSAIAPFGTPVARDFLDQAHELLAARGSGTDGTAQC
jgi:transcriptional regulator with XRE-family HTH domain/tetratricopeptide (TPR) repeat protein